MAKKTSFSGAGRKGKSGDRISSDKIMQLNDSDTVTFPGFKMKGSMRKAIRTEAIKLGEMSEAAIIRRAITVYLGGE